MLNKSLVSTMVLCVLCSTLIHLPVDARPLWPGTAAACRPVADFEEFWKQGLVELAEHQGSLQYDAHTGVVTFTGLDGERCQAMYIPPACGEVAMAMLHIREVDYVPPYLAEPDMYAHLVLRWQPAVRRPGYWTPEGLPDSSQYCMRRAILNVCQLVELFVNQRGVSTSQVALFGEGLGAGVALGVAAVIPQRVRFVVAYQPLPAYHYLPDGRPAPGGLIGAGLLAWQRKYPLWTDEMRTAVGYCDAIRFAGKVTAPTLVVAGGADKVAPLQSVQALYQRLGGPKQLVTVPGLRHKPADAPEGWAEQWARWVVHPAPAQRRYIPTGEPASRLVRVREMLHRLLPMRRRFVVPGLPARLSR